MREETIVCTTYLDSPYGRGVEPYKIQGEEGYWDNGFLTKIARDACSEFNQHPEFKRTEWNVINWYHFRLVHESNDCRITLNINIDPDYTESKTGHWELNHIEVDGKVIEEEGYARYWFASNEVCFKIYEILKSLH